MIKAILFISGFIWLITSVGSISIGPFVGFNRKRILHEMKEFYEENVPSVSLKILRRALFSFAYIGFLLPATRPLIGLVGGLFSLVLVNFF